VCSIPGDDKRLYLFGGRDAKRVFGDMYVIKEVGTDVTSGSGSILLKSDSFTSSTTTTTTSSNNNNSLGGAKWEDIEKTI